MAESTTATRKARRAAANDGEDSVEAEFGGEYSEASLELIRSFGRKGAQFGEVEPLEEQALQPPAQEECDAAVEGLRVLEQSLEAIKHYKPDAKELAWIDYKRALVEDASDGEVTWLKLKAYHHGLDVLRASQGARGAAAGDAYAAASSGSKAEASAHASEVEAARDAVLRAARELLPSSSGEEEDASPAARLASHAQAGASGLLSPTIAAAAAAATPSRTAASAVGGTVYHPDYLEEISLSRQLAQQRQQRSSAFLLGLAAAMGLSAARWWLRRRRAGNGNGGTAAGRRPAAVQPRPQ